MRRRTFLKGAAAGLGLTAAGSATTASGRALANLVLPSLGLDPPSPRTPVEHLVVLMMENRSVDHYLGWYNAENPAFDARQTAAYPDAEGNLVSTRDWGAGSGQPNYHGRGHPDPDHGWNGGRHERNGGACDGWLDPRTGNDDFALSCYGSADLPVWAQLTRGYQTYDRWFCGILGPTYPNRYYLHSATAGGMKNNDFPPEAAAAQGRPEWIHGWDWPTIWTLMDRAGMSSAYYFSNLPTLGLWGERHADKGRHISQFYADAAAGVLPQVSYLDPWFIAPAGVANDDHPHADIRLGQGFLSDVVEAFLTSPLFRKSALVITYDEWGGFWDHV
ncbi:MAG TPA: alkaline phosphatase family protein, partial [Acidimicrobiales bacterium]|nr:alkaline phosphatase family protein [Acidimicrobiales bacterium]